MEKPLGRGSAPTDEPANEVVLRLQASSNDFALMAPGQAAIDNLIRSTRNAVAARTEKSILGLVKPRPWWMPGLVYRFLLRELTCIVITQQVPLTFGHIDITPWPSYRDDFLDSTRYAFGPGALPRNEVASLYLKRGLGPEGVTQYEPGTADPALAMKIDKGLGW